MGFFDKFANIATGGVYGAVKNRKKPGGILRSLASGGALGGGRGRGPVAGKVRGGGGPSLAKDLSQAMPGGMPGMGRPPEMPGQPGPPQFGQMPGLPQPPQMQRPFMMPRPQMPPQLPPMPGPAQAGPEQMPPQTGGPEPRPEEMGMQFPSSPGQYGGFNPRGRRPGGSVFGDPWGGFGG